MAEKFQKEKKDNTCAICGWDNSLLLLLLLVFLFCGGLWEDFGV